MSIKNIKILGTIGIFLLCFPLHFLYNWLPNSLFSIFLPVNESIWEHMKIIYTSFILYGIIDYFWLKKDNEFNNFLLQLFLVPLLGMILYLVIYVPIYNIIGENMLFSIALLAFIIVFEQIISYLLLTAKEIKYQSIIGVIGIILVYIIFGYLTYKPIENYIFFDTKDSKYGINIYIK